MAAVVTPIRPMAGRCLRPLPDVDATLPSPVPTSSPWRRMRVRLVAGRVRWSLLDVARGAGHIHVELVGGLWSVRLCGGKHGGRRRPSSASSPTWPDAA